MALGAKGRRVRTPAEASNDTLPKQSKSTSMSRSAIQQSRLHDEGEYLRSLVANDRQGPQVPRPHVLAIPSAHSEKA